VLGQHVQDNDLASCLAPTEWCGWRGDWCGFPTCRSYPGSDCPAASSARGHLDLVPDLAVEIISRHNTREEMDRKLLDYFAAGVRLVWYVYPATREVHIYASPINTSHSAPKTRSTAATCCPASNCRWRRSSLSRERLAEGISIPQLLAPRRYNPLERRSTPPRETSAVGGRAGNDGRRRSGAAAPTARQPPPARADRPLDRRLAGIVCSRSSSRSRRSGCFTPPDPLQQRPQHLDRFMLASMAG